ncbi:hypothetical protein [Pseudomonas sp. VI4.1]|nr:hypothetical protein [Pseudomonas sp. VI4.1]
MHAEFVLHEDPMWGGLAREWGSTVYLKHPGERVNIAAFVRTTR